MAVATAAATTMAKRAEAARPRRSTAARSSMRTKHGGVRRGSAALGDRCGSEQAARCSCFTSQREDGIEFNGAADGGGASAQKSR